MSNNTHPITITGINSDGTLQLSDKGITTASRGDTIQWIIGNGSGVLKIVEIIDSSSIDVFSPDPKTLSSNPTIWSGKVSNNLTPPCQETYSINYTKIKGGGIVYNCDPKIQIN
jgi:hypothetical protein